MYTNGCRNQRYIFYKHKAIHLELLQSETLFRNKIFSKISMFNFHFLNLIQILNILEMRKNTKMLKYCIFRGLSFSKMLWFLEATL